MRGPCRIHCAVSRTEEVLEEGLRKMAEVARASATSPSPTRSMIWNSDLLEALELRQI